MFLKKKSPVEKMWGETKKMGRQSMRVVSKMSSGKMPLEKGCDRLEKKFSRWQDRIDRIGGDL